jgi:hypothetical protein
MSTISTHHRREPLGRQLLLALLALIAAVAALALRREAPPTAAPVPSSASSAPAAGQAAPAQAATATAQPAAATVAAPVASAKPAKRRARVRAPEPTGGDLLEDAASAGMTSRAKPPTSGTPR